MSEEEKKEKSIEELKSELNATAEELEDTETLEELERHCKNEAYAFLLANGLLDKFLDFRQSYHRNREEDKIFLLTMKANLGGLWIDLE